jgi:glycine/D-amino acid oxidase-like deaminating enzyme
MLTHPEHQRRCGWNQLLPSRVPAPAAEGRIDCDLAVVGAGYTGLAAARRWAQARPTDRICLLEAGAVGEGSPGRNSGFLLEIALAEDAEPAAISRMRVVNALSRSAMQALRTQVEQFGIECDLHRSGTYRAAATDAGIAALDRYRAFLDATGLPCDSLDREALHARLGTRYYRSGLYSPDCWLVQPAALIRGLIEHRPASVALHEHSAVTHITRRPAGDWLVHTEHATLRAGTVVLANNAYAGALGFGAERLTPAYTYAGLTEPLPEGALATLGSDRQWGLLPTAKLGTTLRRTRDGRLLARSLYSYRTELPNADVEAHLVDCLARRFPSLGRVRMASVWGGTTGITLNGAPEWGQRAPGLFVSAGCNGGGVVKGTLLGDLLAASALGEDVPDVRELFGRATRVPPDPLRRIGFDLLTWRWRRQAGAET